MKSNDKKKKLALNVETLRQLQPQELDQVVGGMGFHTDSEVAGGCTVSDSTCDLYWCRCPSFVVC